MLIGNLHVISFFDRSIEKGELSGTYLFVGPEGVGKTYAATQIGQALARNHSMPFTKFITQKEQCACDSCSAISQSTHPDVSVFLHPLTIEGTRLLKTQLAQTPLVSPSRVVIIKNIHRSTPEANQALLKLLEEPNDSTVIFLTAENLSSLLPTIVSRATTVHFFLTPHKLTAELLPREREGVHEKVYKELAPYWRGRPARLVRLQDETYRKKVEDTKKTAERFLRAPLSQRFSIAQTYASLERHEAVASLDEWMIWWEEMHALKSLGLLFRILQSLKRTPVNIQAAVEHLSMEIPNSRCS